MSKLGKGFYNFIKEDSDKKRDRLILLIIMGLSFLFRVFYISYVSVYDMQHDVGTPYEDYGHLGYISYLMREGHLPDFNVTECFQFWHPPFHHGISAVFLKLLWIVFPGIQGNYEPLQFLPLIYITITLYVIYKLLELWNIKGRPLLITMAVMAFQPTFIILSGSVNNDALCVLLSVMALWLGILWYKKPSFLLIILSALAMGFAMAAKGSAAVIAFPLAFLFLMGLIKYKVRIIPQLLLFGVISLPIGMGWYLRNYFLYDVPINYIYRTSTDAIGYLGDIPVWKRVLDFDPRRFSFQNIYVQFEGRFTEINPVIALIKSTVYGQQWFNYNIYIRIIAYPLVFIWIFYTIISASVLPFFVRGKRNGKKGDKEHGNESGSDNKVKNMTYEQEEVEGDNKLESIGVIILFLVQFISYYSFSLSYPYVWTMDVRYAVPLLVCHALLLGEFIKTHPKWEKTIIYISCLFIILTVGCFTALSFTTFG